MRNNSLITICARGGSKGIPNKNIVKVGKYPLIAYTIKFAEILKRKLNCDIILSTDDKEIKNVSSKFNLTTEYTRPNKLGNDTIGKVEVIRDALAYMQTKSKVQYDYVIDLDVTSPLRTMDDLMKAFDILEKDKDSNNIFSVSDPVHNPYFDIVEKKGNGYFDLVKNIGEYYSRQTSPEVYELNASFYIFKKRFFDLNYQTQITPKSLVFKMEHICFEIDSQIEMEFLSFLIEKNKVSNILNY
ncbi:acylneuraminate cytidylyltransferase family protein [Flavobacteriaceae bacterium]|nr:acylneuraminate cytidylyltransferase family protein [Flavobacteriaceae bacterium]